jgi:hypothetical protein
MISKIQKTIENILLWIDIQLNPSIYNDMLLKYDFAKKPLSKKDLWVLFRE